jgi:transposase
MSLADFTAGRPPTTAEQLPDDTAALKRMAPELLASLYQRDRDYEALRHRIDLLLRRLYGPRGERIDPKQLLLFAEMAAGQDTLPAPPEPVAGPRPSRRGRPHGRRLPDNLPREPRHHELSEAERACPACGQRRVDIGTDRSEQLDYRPASLFVVEHFVHKYVCPCRSKQRAQAPEQQVQPGQESEPMPAPQPDPSSAPPPTPATMPAAGQPHTQSEPGGPGQPRTDQDRRPPAPPPACRPLDPSEVVIAAPKPAMPITKGLPGPGPLAHLIVSKYTDHMPLHRLQRAYERQGHFLHRSALCDWRGACADLLLRALDLKGALVTIDAAGCQVEIAQQVREQGGHYLLAVKGNQPHLQRACERVLSEAVAGDFAGLRYDQQAWVEKGHGRQEERYVTVIYDPPGLPEVWPGVTALVCVNRERSIKG